MEMEVTWWVINGMVVDKSRQLEVSEAAAVIGMVGEETWEYMPVAEDKYNYDWVWGTEE